MLGISGCIAGGSYVLPGKIAFYSGSLVPF